MIADLPAFLAARPAGRFRSRDDAMAFTARAWPPRPELAELAAMLAPNLCDPWSVTAACPDCGRATVCGYRSGSAGWLVWPPGRCSGCRASGAVTAPGGPPSLAGAVGHPRPPAAVLAPLSAAAPAAEPEPGPVQIRDGALYVNGAAVAEGVTPADVSLLGRRVFVRGRQVAALAAAWERITR